MRVLIVDDSAIIRAIFEQNLKKLNDETGSHFEIVGSVSTGRKAIDFVRLDPPDIVLCDVDMPEFDGIESTKTIVGELKTPVIVFSENPDDQVKAKRAGAVGFMLKPDVKNYTPDFFKELATKMDAASPAALRKKATAAFVERTLDGSLRPDSSFAELREPTLYPSENPASIKIVCLGASTGGPTAVKSVLTGLGKNFPLPIIYTQHVEVGDDKKMALWLNESCQNINITLAKDGEEAKPGTVYMAPADRHLVIDFVKASGTPVLKISDDPPERFLRPAVNKMFISASNFFKNSCLAVLLTGMGRDGAIGCKKIVENGGYTICEDKSTCAVFGMPAAAIEEGGASEVLPRVFSNLYGGGLADERGAM